MPSIQDAMGADLSAYNPIEAPKVPPAQQNPRRNANTVIRCPLPPFYADPDVLRQFDAGAGVPQVRIIPLPPFTPAAPKVTKAAAAVSTSSSSSSTTTGTTLTAANVTINIASLAAGAAQTGSVAVTKKSFQLLSISSNDPCEVRLYGTALAQLIDSARATDDPVPAEVSQNIISDVIFDTVPYVWGWQNRIAANQDTPQTGTLYVTVVNNTGADLAGVTIVITYLPLES